MNPSEAPLVNRVAQSGLITLNLEQFYPEEPIVSFDLQPLLFQGLILREKEFRDSLSHWDWQQYAGKRLAVFCSTDAIIPMWAYMLVTTHAAPYAKDVMVATPEEYLGRYYALRLSEWNPEQFQDRRIIIKGCSDRPVPASAYSIITHKLLPYAKSIMYGEPCSTVPVYKQSSNARE